MRDGGTDWLAFMANSTRVFSAVVPKLRAAIFTPFKSAMIPFMVLFDGTMSMLRLYLPDELRALVARVPNTESFEWDIGTTSLTGGVGIGLTHLVGVPKP